MLTKYERTRKRDNEYRRKRYAKEPEYRERMLKAAHQYYATHKTEISARNKLRYATNPEFRAGILARQRKYRRTYLLRRYGITVEEYERILARQGGVCAICKKKPKGRYLCVDHCHRTGRIRGLLCSRCNTAIGQFEDNPEYTDAATIYLRAAQKNERSERGLPPARRARTRRRKMPCRRSITTPKAAKPPGRRTRRRGHHPALPV